MLIAMARVAQITRRVLPQEQGVELEQLGPKPRIV